MLNLPRWLPLAVGALVIIFGLYRLRLGLRRSPPADEASRQRGGMYGLGRRTHLLFGIVYLAMGVMLVLSGLGVHLFR
jgi:hypothetical protein